MNIDVDRPDRVCSRRMEYPLLGSTVDRVLAKPVFVQWGGRGAGLARLP